MRMGLFEDRAKDAAMEARRRAAAERAAAEWRARSAGPITTVAGDGQPRWGIFHLSPDALYPVPTAYARAVLDGVFVASARILGITVEFQGYHPGFDPLPPGSGDFPTYTAVIEHRDGGMVREWRRMTPR
jgi:hypothetical protein